MTEQSTPDMTNPFTTALLLVKLDHTVLLLEKEIQKSTAAREQQQAQAETEQKKLTSAQAQIHELRKQLAQYELEDKTALGQERALEKKLDASGSAKEFQALTRELEELRNSKKQIEEKVLSVWSNLEEAQEQVPALEAQVRQQLGILEQQKQTLDAHLVELQEQLAQERAKREGYCALVDPEWLSKYETMRLSVANPVVPVVNGTCSACSFDIVHADLMQLERHVFLPCRGCYRLLYIE